MKQKRNYLSSHVRNAMDIKLDFFTEVSNTIQLNGKCDTDTKAEEIGKKRSIGSEQSDAEPSKKKNKIESDP
jgi:hypothetical protein